MKRSAFTLLEAVVVIAIIAVLVLLAIPALQVSSAHTSHGAEDLSNLKQLGIGIQQYLVDHDEVMFSQAPITDANGVRMAWSQTLQSKYLSDWRVFRSPFDTRLDSSVAPIPLSYGLNKNALTPAANSLSHMAGDTFQGESSQFAFPSELILLAANPTASPTLSFTTVSTDHATISPPPASPPLGTHGNRRLVNVLHADFSSSQLLWKDYSDSTSVPNGQRRWLPLGSPAKP